MIPHWVSPVCRALFAVFSAFTSLYCLLAYLPFTYHQIHQGGLFPVLDRFRDAHPALNLIAWLVSAPVWVPALLRRRGSLLQYGLASGFLLANAAWVFAGLLDAPLAALDGGIWSYVFSLFPAALAIWLGVIGWFEDFDGYPWPESASASGGLFAAALVAAAWVPLAAGAVAFWRQGGVNVAHAIRGYWWSLTAHAVIFLCVFAALHWVSALARYAAKPSRAEFLAIHAGMAAGGAAVLVAAAFRPLGFTGGLAWISSALLAAALVVGHGGLAAWIGRNRASTGLELAFAPLTAGGRATAVGGMAVTLICAFALTRAPAMDWNNLLQKLVAAVFWMASFGVAYTLVNRKLNSPGRWLPYLAGAVALLGGYRKLQARWTPVAAEVESHAAFEVPFQYARELLAPVRAAGGFFELLARNTNLPHSMAVKPVEIDLAAPVTARTGRPNIIIITVDSLRQDYLSPYNPKVDFTPELAEFARESTVFERAFTHYGGTGLSEPSIWAGGMMLHKQYITPFAPMNVLEKLIRGEGYRIRVSRDEILKTILGPARADDRDLDSGKPTMSLDLCGSLEELAPMLASGGAPLFAYTQPQNLHISVIQREGAKAIDGADYAGFHAPYASRLRRLDGCFGRFLTKLKQTGAYRSSIIVFTADHGDSLGEEGRWGHAYTLFPEVVRIPLIIHVPPQLASGLEPAARRVAFSTDIAPTLYRLLGYRDLHPFPMGGRPLFGEPGASPEAPPEEWHLLASSYAPVYGVLSENGRRMYVADGVNFRDYWFDLAAPGAPSRTIPEQVRSAQRGRIADGIRRINQLYRFEREGAGGKP